MREFINFTPEARYWIRTPEGKWYSVLPHDAAWIYGMPAGYYGDIKIRGRVKEVAVLAATPYSYTSKSEVERGAGIVLWDWGLGALDCRRVMASIERITDESRQHTRRTGREPSRFERSYAQLADLLCEAELKSNPSTKKEVAMAKAKTKHFPTGSTVRYTSKFMKSIGMHKGAVDGLVLGTSSRGDRVLVAWSDGHTSMVAPVNLEKARKQPNYDTKSAVTVARVEAREKLDPEMWTQQEIEQIIDGFERDDMTKQEAIAADWAEKNRPEVKRRYGDYMRKVAPLSPMNNPSDTRALKNKLLK